MSQFQFWNDISAELVAASVSTAEAMLTLGFIVYPEQVLADVTGLPISECQKAYVNQHDSQLISGKSE